jgi:hypothetical protein
MRPLAPVLLLVTACSAGTPPVRDGGSDGGPGADGGFDGGTDSGSPDAGRGDAGPSTLAGPVGVYIPTFQQAITGTGSNPLFQQQMMLPYVDGFFVSRSWRQVEPTEGVYAWDSLIADLQAIGAAGKKATVAIGGGASAPPWVCGTASLDGGPAPQCLNLIIRPTTFGGASSCNDQLLPVPWDPAYEARFDAMIQSLAGTLAAHSELTGVVVDVKITGINDTDEETILPGNRARQVACDAGAACVAGVCDETDALGALEDAGYSDATAAQALIHYGRVFHAAFPALPVGSQVSASIPAVDSVNMAFNMVTSLVDAAPAVRPLSVQDQGLAAFSGTDPGTLYAFDAGLPVGYQMLFYVSGDASCVMGRNPDGGNLTVCDETVLLDAIDNGIYTGHAQWLEIYSQDIAAFPDAGAYAHALLVGP